MKRQAKLDTFYAIKPHKRSYFYVDWSVDFNNVDAKWLFDRPLDINFEQEVKWTENSISVTICSNNISGSSILKEENKKILDTSTISLLKSNLQKCIRQKIVQKALETAKLLIKYDLNTFIRRLSIIMLEDVIVHTNFTVLVWLTAAISKGFLITNAIRNWLLGIVKYLCEENRETYWSKDIPSFIQNENFKKKGKVDELMRKYEQEYTPILRNVLISLLFRKSYGGLPNDLLMIMRYERFLTSTAYISKNDDYDDVIIEDSDEVVEGEEYLSANINISTSTIELIDYSLINDLKLIDIELSAVDFHCNSFLVEEIRKQYPHLGNKDIKNAIWHFSSKTNHRVEINQKEYNTMSELYPIWLEIKDYVIEKQKNYINYINNKNV